MCCFSWRRKQRAEDAHSWYKNVFSPLLRIEEQWNERLEEVSRVKYWGL